MESAVFTDKSIPGGEIKHRLGPGVQVRPEDTGLLFYNSKGPRLYYLNSGKLLSPDYFNSGVNLKRWLGDNNCHDEVLLEKLSTALHDLILKEVLIC